MKNKNLLLILLISLLFLLGTLTVLAMVWFKSQTINSTNPENENDSSIPGITSTPGMPESSGNNSSYNSDVCWSYARVDSTNAYWGNGCKGTKGGDILCTQVLVDLTQEEIIEYNKWVAAGKPQIEGCAY